MKNIFFFVCIVVFAMSSVMPIMANEVQGSSCQNPIPLTKDMVFTVSEPGTYWFSSWTYDLPLTVRYTPSVPTNEKINMSSVMVNAPVVPAYPGSAHNLFPM